MDLDEDVELDQHQLPPNFDVKPDLLLLLHLHLHWVLVSVLFGVSYRAELVKFLALQFLSTTFSGLVIIVRTQNAHVITKWALCPHFAFVKL